MTKKIVVSLCDGMSCGAIALDRLGLMDNDVEYHSFENEGAQLSLIDISSHSVVIHYL